MKKSYLALLVVTLVIILDQAIKIYIKTHFEYGESFNIFGLNWAQLYFVENKGMAYGITLGGDYGKLFLSVFRIIMVAVLLFLLKKTIESNQKTSLIVSLSLIIAGAIGNIIDSVFYGMIFSESPRFGGLAQIFPAEGGYSSFLHGKVVDMFYFPFIDTILPAWVPLWGGERFIFFQPIFNLADSSISVGVVLLLIFNREFFFSSKEKEAKKADIDASNETNTEQHSEQL